MPAKIDWLYFRKGCMTCKKAQGYLDEHAVKVAEICDTAKNPHDKKKGLALAEQASRLVVAKGKKVVILDMKKDKPSKAELEGLIIGPTGNLRAPTFFKGKTMVVGFTPEAYKEVLG